MRPSSQDSRKRATEGAKISTSASMTNRTVITSSLADRLLRRLRNFMGLAGNPLRWTGGQLIPVTRESLRKNRFGTGSERVQPNQDRNRTRPRVRPLKSLGV